MMKVVRLNYAGIVSDGKQYVELAGKSTDVKPMGYLTGSKFTEIDTGYVYAYDETSGGSWTKIAELLG